MKTVSSSTMNTAVNPSPTWHVDARCFFRESGVSGAFDQIAVKDPSIVYSGGLYHLFYTGATSGGSWQMGYASATTIAGLSSATHVFFSKLSESYFCAPEVFYYEPQSKWYMIYQDGNCGTAYATTTNIADPNSWSGPYSLGVSGNTGWDYYVICDDTYAYLFNTPSDGSHKIYCRKTTLANFPKGWGTPWVAVSGAFEGTCVYKCLADGQYYLLVENDSDNRYFELWTASSLGGTWTQVADKWASQHNLIFNADHWTDNVSHGELLRAGTNQKLEINDINHADFLIQGVVNGNYGDYVKIPWDLGVIHNYNNGSQNLITNPGIETGDITGWTAMGAGSIAASTAQKHSGTYSLLSIGRTATWNGPLQNITSKVQSGKTYACSGWVRLDNAASDSITMTIRKVDGSGTTYTNVATGTGSNSSWVQLSGNYTLTVSGTLTELSIYFEGPGSGINYYVDDVSVQ